MLNYESNCRKSNYRKKKTMLDYKIVSIKRMLMLPVESIQDLRKKKLKRLLHMPWYKKFFR